MSIFDRLKQSAVDAAATAATAIGNKRETFTFAALPESLAQLQALPEAALDTPFQAAVLTVLALCAYPFLQLGIQYLLYKLTAFLASVIGDTELCGLIGGLGGAFGLILGMVGSCALVLLVSILASAAVVTS